MQRCPICFNSVQPFARYPNYVCNDCCEKVVDRKGREVWFRNLDMWGGFEGVYADDGSPYDSNICFIKGMRCTAEEARFGGIVFQPVALEGQRESLNMEQNPKIKELLGKQKKKD